MKILLEILLALTLIYLFYQDIKDRKVTVLLLVLGGLFGGVLNFLHHIPLVFYFNVLINLLFVLVIFLILYLYAKLKMRQPVFEVFGEGDLLFFIMMAISLPILSFIMVFIFSTFFSLVVFFFFRKKFKNQTVPLAGLQSLFFALVLIANILIPDLNLYSL